MEGQRERANGGFTLLEMLVVVAIIGVMIAIAIPVFSGQLNRSKEAVDLANMRSAYSAASVEWMTSGDYGKPAMYFFNGSEIVKSSTGIKGYGQSSTDASEFSDDLPCSATGVPNHNGNPGYIVVRVDASGTMSMTWNSGPYAGENVLSPEEYRELTFEEKLAKDVLLLDSIQNDVRSMTYGELKSLFFDERGNRRPGLAYGSLKDSDGVYKLCVVIAKGTIDTDGQAVTGNGKTTIYTPELFQNAGFDTGLDDDQTYIINSVEANTNSVWLNLRITESELKNLSSSNPKWNETATRAYTYVKSDGATTPDPLRDATRKTM